MGQQGNDILYGEGGDDILIGGSNVSGALDGDDVIDGGAGDDLIAGDNAECCLRPDLLDPRMRALQGGVIYGTNIVAGTDGIALVTPTAQPDPTGIQQYRITLLDHSDTIEADRPDLWGDDYIAGGAGSDEIYGELGNDVIQGDGRVNGLVLEVSSFGRDGEFLLTVAGRPIAASDLWPHLLPDGPTGQRIGAWRSTDQTIDETLVVHGSDELTTDGDDYIEGNGGNDTIFGNLGQDDIVGDSSDLYGLGDNQTLTLSQRVAGVTTFLKDAAGKVVEWRVIGLSADGLTLTLAGRRSASPPASRHSTCTAPASRNPSRSS